MNPSAYAEERLEKYRYYQDGTYSKASGSSVRLGSAKDDPEIVDDNAGAGFAESEIGIHFDDSSSVSHSSWSLRGSYGKNVTQNLHIQGDVDYTYLSGALSLSDELSGTVHVSTQVNDNVAVGGFVQTGLLGGDGSYQYSLGAEAAVFGENITTWARVGYGKVSLANADGDYIIGSVGAQYYINDNFRIDGEARIAEDVWSVHSRVNYRMQRWPNTSLHLGYRHISIDGTSGGSSADTVFAGVRYSYGSRTLKEEQQNGVRWEKIR